MARLGQAGASRLCLVDDPATEDALDHRPADLAEALDLLVVGARCAVVGDPGLDTRLRALRLDGLARPLRWDS